MKNLVALHGVRTPLVQIQSFSHTCHLWLKERVCRRLALCGLQEAHKADAENQKDNADHSAHHVAIHIAIVSRVHPASLLDKSPFRH